MIWLRRLSWGLIAVLALSALSLWTYRRLALPVTTGRIEVAGLRSGLSITRDAKGIPTIRAGSIEDAAFGLGFVHAQDRLWQLETHKRIGAGRLAEAFGPPALENDRFLRALGVRRTAELQWAQAAPALRSVIEAYTAGINAYLADHLRARPPEFVLLGLQPEPWTPVDSLAWSTMMAWDLGGNWNTELLRMRLALTMPVSRINELLPPYPGEAPLQTLDYAALFRRLGVGDAPAPAPATAPTADGTERGSRSALPVPTSTVPRSSEPAARTDGWPTSRQRVDQAQSTTVPWQIESGVEGVGSNNWAVSGLRSVTGKPLLANDPHLKLSAPSLWYLARIEAPGLQVAGATMPGLPLVVLGQNEHIAWGFTNTNPDVQDLYLERIDPRDPARYETPDGWAAFETHTETIRVKGQADVSFTVRHTRHGPVISDADTPATRGLTGRDAAPDAAPRFVLAMRWTALDTDASKTLLAGLAFNRARSVEEFVAATADYVAPMQNMLVADRSRIAMVSAGRVPVRRGDHDLKGLVPAPGWNARYDWEGYLPAPLTPREFDPARGWIATANQRIHSEDYPHFITSEWTVPYRQQRIEQLLNARTLHSLDSLAAIQADVVSLATQRLLPFLLRAESAHPLAATALASLRGFNGAMTADDAAPLIFWAWARQLTRGVFADDMGPELFERQIGSRSFREALEKVLERNDPYWCDDITTPPIETCATQINAAFTRALDELQASQGSDVRAWRWGRSHVARAEHRPFSRVPTLARWFELRTPVGGDTFTVNVARVGLRPDGMTGELYLAEHGPGLRALYDLNDRSRSRFIQSGGQSGLPFSPHYDDFLDAWARVEYLPVWGRASAGDTLQLEPKPAAR